MKTKKEILNMTKKERFTLTKETLKEIQKIGGFSC